jgi:YVTN family beta-propeller protein
MIRTTIAGGSRVLLLSVSLGSLLFGCAGTSDTRPEKRAPVENPDLKNGPTAGNSQETAGKQDWALEQVSRTLAQTGHLLNPAGQRLNVSGRVMDLKLVRDGKYLVVKTDAGPLVVETGAFNQAKAFSVPEKLLGEAEREKKLRAEAEKNPRIKDDPQWEKKLKAKADLGWGTWGGSMHGLAVGEDDATVYFTSKAQHLFVARVNEQGELVYGPTISLAIDKKNTDPLGVAVAPGGKLALVALALADAVAVVDLEAGKMVATIPVGVCPYGVAISRDGQTAFVSNFGGSRPKPGDKTEKTMGMDKEGTDLAVDERAMTLRGTISVIQLAKRQVVGEIATGIHPESMTLSPDGKQLYVVDAGGDGVSVIDVVRRTVVNRLTTKPGADLPYGSLANGIAIGGDGKTLFTANAGNNAVALINAERPQDPPYAFISAGGFPGAVCVAGDNLFIGNVTAYACDLQKVVIPKETAELKKLTAEASRDFHLAEIVRAQMRAQAGVPPKAMPARVGDPSPIKHIVYIIKENKKYDQVLGDIGRGNSEPNFCEFPRATTPNIHALADDFVLLDNYYCNGVLSCDGHQWAVQGLTSPMREKDWSNQHISYSFGRDPLCFAGCGFLWDHVLRQGLSFRNFGELGNGVFPKGNKWTDNYKAWKSGQGAASFSSDYRFEAIRRYSDLRYPGWEMLIPDQYRADVFLAALKEFEQAGKMPELVIIYLPNDHTQHGSINNPTPRAYVADNDLAVGRVVEGLSKSPFWKEMAIFINEDDPQTGVDHVDGHRSYCLVASPYAKRGGTVVSHFYNQSSVLHSICRILGVPPMNQMVAMSPVMADCFQDTPDFTPYACRPANVPLDELNPDPKQIKSKTQAKLAPRTLKLDFSAPDRIDEDAVMFSRWVWSTVRGDDRFPVEYTGAHGKGLKALGLRLDPNVVEEDD